MAPYTWTILKGHLQQWGVSAHWLHLSVGTAQTVMHTAHSQPSQAQEVAAPPAFSAGHCQGRCCVGAPAWEHLHLVSENVHIHYMLKPVPVSPREAKQHNRTRGSTCKPDSSMEPWPNLNRVNQRVT